MRINGGERAGNNLFHSFDEFNLPEGMEAIFENGLDIENIFTRITGDSISNIDGILSAQGGANLFLINPNGIVFGDNAAINIGGSFIATTADTIKFADGTELVARRENGKPILTIHFPIGLGFGSNGKNGAIEVNGEGNEVTIDSPISPTTVESEGIEVESGNTLALIGNDLTIDGGTVNAPEGNLELGSVDFGEIAIQPTDSGFDFNYSNVETYSDIALTNQAALTSSGQGGGAIAVTGENVSLENGSTAIIANQGALSSGDINIKAIETFTFSGTSKDGTTSSSVRAQALDSGAGGNVNISTGDLVIQDASSIVAITFSDGKGGNVNIDASNSIELLENTVSDPNRTSSNSPVSGIVAPTYGSADAGNVRVSAKQIRITDGGNIGSPAILGTGNGGEIDVQADLIELIGTKEPEALPSSIFASTFSSGNAGDVKVDTSKLRIVNGANINSSSIGEGNSSNVSINASESIEVIGQSQSPTEPQPSNISSSITVADETLQQAFGLDSQPSGNAGNVTVNTPFLKVAQEGTLSVGNQGTGNAGTLTVDASEVSLDNTGSITAASVSGTGGNININTTNLTAKKDSAISANADGGNGGNITIDAETILGLNNSDITANAVGGNGGNITIDSDFMVGLEERSRLTPFNDITPMLNNS